MIDAKLKMQIYAEYNKEKSLRKTANIVGISASTVKKYVDEKGLKVAKKNIVSKLNEEDDLLVGLYSGIWAGDGTQYYDNSYTIKYAATQKILN
jgi:hypothetical protein